MSLLPLQSKVLKVFQLSANFREAVRLVTETIESLSADEILVKNLYIGVNATDLNITAGRYFKHGAIPYKFGIEVCNAICESTPTKGGPVSRSNSVDRCFGGRLSSGSVRGSEANANASICGVFGIMLQYWHGGTSALIRPI